MLGLENKMSTYNYAIVIVKDTIDGNGYDSHYAEVRTYQYLDDARYDFKNDAVEVYKEAQEDINRPYADDDPYHLELVKLKWDGNFSQVVKRYN